MVVVVVVVVIVVVVVVVVVSERQKVCTQFLSSNNLIQINLKNIKFL